MNKEYKVPVLEKVDRCEIDMKKLWCSRTKYPDRVVKKVDNISIREKC